MYSCHHKLQSEHVLMRLCFYLLVYSCHHVLRCEHVLMRACTFIHLYSCHQILQSEHVLMRLNFHSLCVLGCFHLSCLVCTSIYLQKLVESCGVELAVISFMFTLVYKRLLTCVVLMLPSICLVLVLVQMCTASLWSSMFLYVRPTDMYSWKWFLLTL